MDNHIPTLLLREWMQHKRGWLIAAFAPPLLFLAMLPFGNVQGLPDQHRELLALAILLISTAASFAICLVVALFQLPGLARRDAQDRSIEFWLSLPGRPSESVAATVLAHAWLAPLGGAVVGMLFGLPIAMSVLGRQDGFAAVSAVGWGEVVNAAAPLLLRGLAGTLPLLLWLAPLILVLMAASAWLKRLGVPLVLVGTVVAVLVLGKVYGIVWPQQAIASWNTQVNTTLIHNGNGLKDALMSDTNLWTWVAHDFAQTMGQLATLEFVGWTALAAAGFALVVAKRARGG
jgi:ABC-2 type transport system permease protein